MSGIGLEEDLRIRRDFILDITTESYSRAQAYTSFIIGAGYASFLAIWHTAYGDLDPNYRVWAIIFLSISILVFVVFEVTKMILSSVMLLKQANIVSLDNNSFMEALKVANQKKKEMISTHLRIWVFTLVTTVSTAFLALLFLYLGFASALG